MVDRILAWLRSLPQRFINWWEKFTARQKTAIIIIAFAVIIAFAILIVSLTRPTYVTIYTADTAKQAQEVLTLLDDNGIEHKTSEDGLIIQINKKDYTTTNLLLGSNDIYVDAYSIDNVTNGGFSSTESDKQKKYVVYLENLFEDTIRSYNFVKDVTVQLNIPTDDGTLIAKNTASSASVLLNLKDPEACTPEVASAIAKFVATALGNENTANIVILDTDGNLLFSGHDESTSMGNASSQYALREQITNAVIADVRQLLLATNQFTSVEIAANLVLDSSYTEESEHLYWGNEENGYQGPYASSDIYQSTNEGGVGGVPGTDSNTETTYVMEDSEYSTSSVIEQSYDYVPNESTTLRQIPAGTIKYDESSISITALTYKIIKEDDIKRQGLLDGTTWEEYKLANSDRVKLVPEDDLYSVVSTATGIGTDRITIIHYQEPFFIDSEGFAVDSTDIITIVLIILILALLAFVVIRSMKTAQVEQEEEEISIEDILKSTPAEELEEIGVEDKSEARKIVEKFVEDNPEASANLLRNWLSEDWG